MLTRVFENENTLSASLRCRTAMKSHWLFLTSPNGCSAVLIHFSTTILTAGADDFAITLPEGFADWDIANAAIE